MFNVNVNTDNPDFIELLSIEGTKGENSSFGFSSEERAAFVLSQVVYQQLKESCLEEVIQDGENAKSERASFTLFIPHDYEEMWRKRVEEHLLYYFEGEKGSDIFIEGYIMFRLKDLREKYLEYLKTEYEHFVGITSEPSGSLDALIDYMHSQPTQIEELIIKTYKNGVIELLSNGVCLFREDEEAQENVVVQSIFNSPQTVRVFDKNNVLRKESIIVLKQLFGSSIVFEKE